jgi:hypothetical protein
MVGRGAAIVIILLFFKILRGRTSARRDAGMEYCQSLVGVGFQSTLGMLLG